jgi:hypothetical protein
LDDQHYQRHEEEHDWGHISMVSSKVEGTITFHIVRCKLHTTTCFNLLVE